MIKQALLESPFSYSERARRPVCTLDRSVRLAGLCDHLEAAFYPKYTYDTAAAAAQKKKKTSTFKLLGPRAGRQRGLRVDRELQALTLGRPIKGKYHPFTGRVWTFLERNGYTPIAAQVGVGTLDRQLRLFTAVDLVCTFRGHPGHVVLVELKVCESHYYELPGKKPGPGKLLAPYHQYPDSPRNQHQLQLGWTRFLFERTFPHVPVLGALVLRVHAGGINTYPLEPWAFLPRATPALTVAIARIALVRDKKKRTKTKSLRGRKRRPHAKALRRAALFKRKRSKTTLKRSKPT